MAARAPERAGVIEASCRHVRTTACLFLLLVPILAAGCGGAAGGAASPADVDFAKQYIALFQSRALAAVEMGMDPSIKDPQIRTKIVQMASAFPPGEPTSVRLSGSTVSRAGNTTTSNLSFEYQYPGRWILATVLVERNGQASVVKGVQIQPLKDSLERLNRVTFAGKGAAHYLVPAVAALVLLFVLYAFFLAVRTPAPGMKWGWALIVLIGVVQVTFNWTTGTLTISPMSLRFLGSWFSKPSPFDPLLITTSLPVGAIVYLIQRREWFQETDSPAEPPQ